MAQPAEISVPAVPGPPPRSPFPLMASIAPVVAAGAIWAITRSPYVLMFAILGPVIAIAGVIDNRWFAKRSLRRQSREYATRIAEVEDLVATSHAAERRTRLLQAPTAREVLADAGRVTRWRARGERRRSLTLGLGDRASAVVLSGAITDEAHAELRASAASLASAPCSVDAAQGVGIVGPVVLARAVARGYLLQLCHAADPTMLRVVSLPEEGWDWARTLPHVSSHADERALSLRIIEDPAAPAPPADITIAVARNVDAVPASCAEIIECQAAVAATWLSSGEPGAATSMTTHPVTVAAASAYAGTLARLAVDTGLTGHGEEAPNAVAWRELRRDAAAGQLSVPLGRSAVATVSVDLGEHGPHAVIGGTTGSGKSELLATWVLGLAAHNAPEDVSLLLVDFKGGATFAPLQRLPHVVGVITDLDPAGATRALESLKAEVRYRERTLREHGVQDIADVGGALARLVIVVDEFAAMLDGFPELHALFVDVAARGRSLGMHLLLCTQRPTGVVRDSLLANCTLRLSLRVNNRADSIAVTGVDTAAALPVAPAGRCVVVVPDAEPVVVQIARVTEADISEVAADHVSAVRPRRPWLDPLPELISLTELPGSADCFSIGMRDVPSRQTQELAQWRPDRDGSLLVLGGARSGKSTLAHVLAEQSGERWRVELLPDDLERAFDILEETAATTERLSAADAHRGTVLVFDDIDAFCGRLDDEDSEHVRSLLRRLLRSGPRAGIWIVGTAQRLGAGMSSISASFDSTILLRMPSRQEHILSGGDTGSWAEDRTPGSGVWNGAAVQLAYAERTRRPRGPLTPPALVVDADETVVINCRRPVDTARGLRERFPAAKVITLSSTPASPAAIGDDTGVVVVGDSDSWQANWSLLSALRARATLVVEGCPPADYRAMSRSRIRPPYLHREPGRAWRIAEDGVVTRCLL